jgi:hypothetical protein
MLLSGVFYELSTESIASIYYVMGETQTKVNKHQQGAR